MSLVFVDDAEMRDINRRFRNRAATTDVLAFPLDDGAARDPDLTVGEIIVSTGRAVVEARRRRIRAERELYLYVIHGLLHLLGYEDETPRERLRMRRRERELLALASGPRVKRGRGRKAAPDERSRDEA